MNMEKGMPMRKSLISRRLEAIPKLIDTITLIPINMNDINETILSFLFLYKKPINKLIRNDASNNTDIIDSPCIKPAGKVDASNFNYRQIADN